MGEESSDPAQAPTGTVFLSYASEDSEAARRICEALRAGGIEVWFDQSELRGGDAWDQSIRAQIRSCSLFIPVISCNTHARHEGYFRLEWKLAIDRSYLIMANKAFLLPVVVDATPEDDPNVPERFRDLQWTRLPGGETSPGFVRHVRRLLQPGAGPADGRSRGTAAPPRRMGPWLLAGALILVATAFLLERHWLSGPATTPSAAIRAAVSAAAFAPPPHSIAVLPFVNMSGDPQQEYFSDGLTEEILDALAKVNQLQVAARTSAFSFKGKDTEIGEIARKLNVGAVLEGSVRRSPRTVRVTAQLIDAVTGFHMWSETYDRDPGDALTLQTQIATAVANALKVSLLKDTSGNIDLGSTRDPAAFDAYLRGRKLAVMASSSKRSQEAIAAFTEAIRIDPNYALAFAERSLELANYGTFNATGSEIQQYYGRARADAQKALTLAPDLALAHYVEAVALLMQLDFRGASEEYRRALELAPGSSRILVAYSRNAAQMGQTAEAIAAGRRAIALDPLNFHVFRGVGIALADARQYEEAANAFKSAISLRPDYVRNQALLGDLYYTMGNYDASRAECEAAAKADAGDSVAQVCLARTYQRLGRPAEARAMLRKVRDAAGDDGAYDYACILAQWGDHARALDWLETALRKRDPGLSALRVEPDLDPLREEPRFKAIEHALNFPQ